MSCRVLHSLYRMPLQFIFALFGIQCVIHSSVREALLGWHEYFVGNGKKVRKTAPLCLFLVI